MINDGIHEGQEHFTVTMSSVDSAHHLISNVATVVINDPEDGALVCMCICVCVCIYVCKLHHLDVNVCKFLNLFRYMYIYVSNNYVLLILQFHLCRLPKT